ncbi:hypothetical protein OVA10_05595 [Lelliottia sp. SL45]|uniref:hypothetical protein n=1 Tax=Lelliottia sp. SL45 TaxID=2994665 RepID=UPI0022740DB9|nr:hypothetical protein [Lelliottia sp. SL45]MCY1697549.1 hypothetical protein [Lelliottia sp. SL45]
MSNVLNFKSGNPDIFHAEATPDGVKIMTRNDAGIYEHVELISYECAVARLIVGEYDGQPGIGLAIHGAVVDGGDNGWFDFTAQQHLEMWRWLVAAAFICDMKRENGTTSVAEADGTTSQVAIYSNGKTGIVVYPFSERLAMANNIEGGLIERYGIEQGTEHAITFYTRMIDADAGVISDFGREVLAELHDHFIADLEQNGLPEQPMAH